jgi:hypothetical protein
MAEEEKTPHPDSIVEEARKIIDQQANVVESENFMRAFLPHLSTVGFIRKYLVDVAGFLPDTAEEMALAVWYKWFPPPEPDYDDDD